jgi:hypothetical protein
VLSERWQRLHDECKLDLQQQVKHVLLALGPPRTNPAPGTGPVLMVVVGSVVISSQKLTQLTPLLGMAMPGMGGN